MRRDLLNLSEEDLTAFTNRGAFKRSVKELDSDKLTCKIDEDGNSLIFNWSDEVTCIFPPNKAFSEEMCNCISTKVCRHIIRSILHYQNSCENREEKEPQGDSWSPANFTNEQLSEAFENKAVSRLQKLFNNGLTIELFTGKKPMAYIHEFSVSVRFLAKESIYLTQCNCEEAAPCSHVLLAYWAFLEMPENEDAFLYYNNENFNSDLGSLFLAFDNFLSECLSHGLNSINDYVFLKLSSVRLECEKLKLEFPALVIDDIKRELIYYNENNSRFDPSVLIFSIAEFLIRIDALKNKTSATPANFIKGFSSTRSVKMDASQFTGLGCDVKVTDKNFIFTSYLQNHKTGQILAAGTTKSKDEVSGTFSSAARSCRHASKSLYEIGKGRLTVRSVNCQTDRTLKFGRQKISYTAQNCQWEKLGTSREDFREVQKHLLLQPPASLRPRYVTENFTILKVANVEGAFFDNRMQEVCATLKDENEQEIYLKHPYMVKNAEGTDLLLKALTEEKIIFVSGHISNNVNGIFIQPVAVVYEQDGIRFMVMPWVDKGDASSDYHNDLLLDELDPLEQFFNLLMQLEEELLLMGCERISEGTLNLAVSLQKQSVKLGLIHYSKKLNSLIQKLEESKHSTGHNTGKTIFEIVELFILHKLSRDIMN